MTNPNKPGSDLLSLKRRLEKKGDTPGTGLTDLRGLKRRLEKKVSTPPPLRCVVIHEGITISEHTFDRAVTKVGKLRSSDLCLEAEDVARMHAVLERQDDVWRVIDLGSSSGTKLNGIRVEKQQILPPNGRLTFGPFEVMYVLGEASLSDLVDDIAKAELDLAGRDHHKAMMEGLMEEMERMAPASHRSASFMQKGWNLFDDVKKRKYLRMMVEAIRGSRLESRRFNERRAAGMLALGPEGIEALYDATPEEAMVKAHQTLQEMANAKSSLELLRGMSLMSGVEEALGASAQAQGEATPNIQALQFLKGGHERVEDRLETIVAAGMTILLACLSRAGGAELSDQEREHLRAQWDAAVNEAKTT